MPPLKKIVKINLSTEEAVLYNSTREAAIEIYNNLNSDKKRPTITSICGNISSCASSNGNDITEKETGKKTNRKRRESSNGYVWVYSDDLDTIGLEKFLEDRIPKKLIKDHYPQIFKEIDKTKNQGINLDALTHGSHVKLWFVCQNDHSYQSVIKNRALRGDGCMECYNNRRTPDRKERKEQIDNHVPDVSKILIGDKSEDKIVEILKNTNSYLSVERTINVDKTDIIVTLSDGRKKSVQVKTLSLTKFDSYDFEHITKYDPDMLIVAINQEADKFVIGFHKEFTSYTFNFNKKRQIHWNLMFDDITSFTKKLIELIPLSCDYVENLPKNYKMEKESILRFTTQNKNLNIVRTTNSNEIDLFANEIPIQAKYVSQNHDNRTAFTVQFNTNCGIRKGKAVKGAYNIKSRFLYLLIEAGSNDSEKPEMYHNHFYLIPKKELIKQGRFHIKHLKIEGKQVVSVCPPYYTGNHEYKRYWIYPEDELFTEGRIIKVKRANGEIDDLGVTKTDLENYGLLTEKEMEYEKEKEEVKEEIKEKENIVSKEELEIIFEEEEEYIAEILEEEYFATIGISEEKE